MDCIEAEGFELSDGDTEILRQNDAIAMAARVRALTPMENPVVVTPAHMAQIKNELWPKVFIGQRTIMAGSESAIWNLTSCTLTRPFIGRKPDICSFHCFTGFVTTFIAPILAPLPITPETK